MTAVTLYSDVTGPDDAPFLLLLNSLGATHAMWDAQLPQLSRHYRVIRCDTRGHGQSPTPDGPYSFDDIVADVVAVLDHHGAETATVMGLSMGGMTALGLGLAHPGRVRQIICCGARADAPPPFVQSWHDRLALLETGGIGAVWDATLDKWLSEETRTGHPDRIAALAAGFLQTRPAGYRGCAEALMRLDYRKDLPAMTVPVLYIAGALDVAASSATMQDMAQATPGAEFAEIPGAAHIINVDQPRDFLLAIASALGLDVE